MLNRTNLTLSALALSNRLNLGTRSLAANAGAHHGVENLRTRHSLHDIMRDGMVWQDGFAIRVSRYAIPPIPSSFSPVRQRQESCVRVQQERFAVDVRIEPDPRPVNLVGRCEPGVTHCDSRSGPITASRLTRGKQTLFPARPNSQSSAEPGLKRTAKRAARHAALANSATPGK
jgi:hypothetical protein